MNSKYEEYKQHLQKIADIDNSTSVLHWDQEIYMPPKGLAFRSRQLATLVGLSHELSVSKDFKKLLKQLLSGNSLSPKEVKNIELTLEEYNKNVKYPVEFVQEMQKINSEAFGAWRTARETNNFRLFAPYLEKTIQLRKKECEIVGYEEHPYDAQLDKYEPGAKTSALTILFSDVKNQLVNFVKEINTCPSIKDDFMYLHYDKKKQWDLGIYLLQQMGYDFDSGRQDISPHPFTTSFGALDVRITTRINENDIHEMIWSCIHEGGHALYEQGLNADDYGLPTGSSISLGIHESQSRLWENNVGRSLSYWKANYNKIQEMFPENLKSISLSEFYAAMNRVKPSLIRTSSDEITYHFHILIRFELEKMLLEGDIKVMDMPYYWNQKYKEYLDIDVPSDANGILQDIHWAHGNFGYFPTYSLGSFYAAQFYAKASQDIPNLNNHIENGNMKPLLLWLRQNIHQYGKLYTAEELCVKVTGEKLNFKYFMEYVKKKYTELYALK